MSGCHIWRPARRICVSIFFRRIYIYDFFPLHKFFSSRLQRSTTGNNSWTKLDTRQWRLRHWIGLHCSWRCNIGCKWTDTQVEQYRKMWRTIDDSASLNLFRMSRTITPLVSVHCRLKMRLFPCTINLMARAVVGSELFRIQIVQNYKIQFDWL